VAARVKREKLIRIVPGYEGIRWVVEVSQSAAELALRNSEALMQAGVQLECG
jgi:hypothetical protein